MKRPLALLGGTAFAAVAAAALLGAEKSRNLAAVAAGLGLCALFAALLCHFVKKLSALRGARAFVLFLGASAAALLTAAACLVSFCARWEKIAAPVRELAGERVRIRATVLDFPEEAYHKATYLLRVERVQRGEELLTLPDFTARVSTWTPFPCKPYDTLECTVKFFAFDSAGGLYSTRNARLADGVALGGYLSDYGDWTVIPGQGSSPGKAAVQLRHQVGRSFEKLLPSAEAGLLRGMLLGERDRVPEEASWDFRNIGSSHLLVISGLHMTAVTGLLMLLVSRLPCRRRTKNLLAALGVLGFLALTGFPAAAVRAGIMAVAALSAGVLGRRADGLNSLGAAVLGMCLFQPFLGGDLGFALSVWGTLGILVLAGPLAERMLRPLDRRPRLQKALSFWVQVLAMTASVQLFTLPYQIFVFGGMSLLTPLASLLLALPCALMLYCGATGALLGLPPFLAGAADPVVLLAGWLARLVLWLAHGLGSLPGFFLDLSRPAPLAAVGVLLLIGAIVVWRREERVVRRCAVMGMAVLCLGGMALSSLSRQEAVTFAAPPDSSCVLVMRGDRAAVLSLGGYQTGAAQEVLRRNNISRVEMIYLPVRDQDARAAAVKILEHFPVDRLVLPEGGYLGKDLTAAAGEAEVCFLGEGDPMTLLDGITVTAEQEMRRLTVDVNGFTVMVETGVTGEGSCGLLFTNQEGTAVNSSLSVLQNGDIIEAYNGTLPEELPAGNYVLPAGDGVYLDLFPADGTFQVRGETVGWW